MQVSTIFIDENISVIKGSQAEERLKSKNDSAFLTNNGIIKVTKERWEEAQRYEKKTWMEAPSVNDDHNEENKRKLGEYLVLKDATISSILEIGCGPFTNVRTMIPEVCNPQTIALLDPLLNSYLSHPNCSYKNGEMKGKLVKQYSMPIEEFQADTSYDLVVLINVLEHCYDVPAVLQKVLESVHVGSFFVFGDICFDQADLQEIALKTYDSGHPLRLEKNYLLDFLSSNFEPLFLLEEERKWGTGVHFIGKRK